MSKTVQVYDGNGTEPLPERPKVSGIEDRPRSTVEPPKIPTVEDRVRARPLGEWNDPPCAIKGCRSEQKWKRHWWLLWLFVRTSIGCTNPECENYYDRYREVGFGGL